MLGRQNSNINSAIKVNSLTLDPTLYNVGENGFMFTLYSAKYNENYYKLFDKTYFTLKMTQIIITKESLGPAYTNRIGKLIEYSYCDDRFSRVLDPSLSKNLLMSYTICPKTTDLIIGGNNLSIQNSYFQISIEKCSNETY